MPYKYRHVNGEIITKPDIVVDSDPGGPSAYFNSPFVEEWWYEDDDGKRHDGRKCYERGRD